MEMNRRMGRTAHRPLQLGEATKAVREEDGEWVVAFVARTLGFVQEGLARVQPTMG